MIIFFKGWGSQRTLSRTAAHSIQLIFQFKDAPTSLSNTSIICYIKMILPFVRLNHTKKHSFNRPWLRLISRNLIFQDRFWNFLFRSRSWKTMSPGFHSKVKKVPRSLHHIEEMSRQGDRNQALTTLKTASMVVSPASTFKYPYCSMVIMPALTASAWRPRSLPCS